MTPPTNAEPATALAAIAPSIRRPRTVRCEQRFVVPD
ncbi:MAG: hypothetical protein JWN32_3762 [Solirubrobacterales bacterium]|jgi:hypothetical protein|nr:hypothetical protein [Solirubrobacterales bacterium]